MRFAIIVILSCLIVSTAILTGCEEKQETRVDWTEATYAEMTDNQKASQLFCLTVDPIRYFLYPDYTESINHLIGKYNPGALYLASVIDTVDMEIRIEFNANKLHDELLNLQEISRVPLIIGADFESGAWIWDLNATQFPYPIALSAADNPEFAYRQGKITSVEAREQGINCIFSPLVSIDIDVTNKHMMLNSLGQDPVYTEIMGANYIKGCQEAGIVACARYFPAPFSGALGMLGPDDVAPAQLDIFKHCIDNGLMAFITSPIGVNDGVVPGNPENPGRLVRDLLRDDLGFDGLVFAPLETSYEKENASVEKDLIRSLFSAGVNMIVLPETTDSSIPSFDLIRGEVEDGTLPIDSIEHLVLKNLETKRSLGLETIRGGRSLRSMAGIGLPEYARNSRDIAEACITMLKNDSNLIPVDPKNDYIVSIAFLDEFAPHYATLFDNYLSSLVTTLNHINVFGQPDQRIAHEAIRRSGEANVVVCAFFLKPGDTNEPVFTPEVRNLINSILATNKKVIAITFYDPYLITDLPGVQSFIATYSPSIYSIEAAIDVLVGEHPAQGRLPLNVSDAYPIGFRMAK